MKNKFITLSLISTLAGCVNSSQRVPNNYKNLIDCKNKVQTNSKNYTEQITACTPQADAFVRSQETYHLNQHEQLLAFHTTYDIYSQQKDRGARGLDEIFSRLDQAHQNRELALKVYRTYLKERDLLRADEFRQNYPQYNLRRPPQLSGSTKEQAPAVLTVVNSRQLRLKNWEPGSSAVIVFGSWSDLSRSSVIKSLNPLSPAQKTKVHILLKQDEDLLESIDWSLKQKDWDVHLIYREKAFEGVIPQFATPQVYFFSGKEIKYQINDLKIELEPELKKGFKAIGLN